MCSAYYIAQQVSTKKCCNILKPHIEACNEDLQAASQSPLHTVYLQLMATEEQPSGLPCLLLMCMGMLLLLGSQVSIMLNISNPISSVSLCFIDNPCVRDEIIKGTLFICNIYELAA